MDTSGIQGIYRYRHEIRVSDMPDCRWLRSHLMRCCNLTLVTGTTVVNGTIEPILKIEGGKAVFYGISIAGVARLLGLERFSP